MPFVKVVKSSSYMSRFQTKPRRRREGRTDFRQRRRYSRRFIAVLDAVLGIGGVEVDF